MYLKPLPPQQKIQNIIKMLIITICDVLFFF